MTLGGVALGGPVSLPGGVVDWELRAGVVPFEAAWEVTQSRADLLVSMRGSALTLVMKGPRKQATFEGVYLLEIHPGRTDHTRVLRLADRRWLWSRHHVEAHCNVRRSTGERFMLTNETLLENSESEDDIKYATFSLYPPEAPASKWTADTLLKFVFAELGQPYKVKGALPDVEIQDLVLEGSGSDVLDSVLRYLPGADVYLDKSGTAVVYDTRTEEPGLLGRLQARPQAVGVYARLVDRSATRPRAVRVLFDPEVECKFTYREGGTQVRDSTGLTNVLETPDLTTRVAGKDVARGSVVDMDSAFTAWGAFGLFRRAVSFAELRRFALKSGFASFEGIWGNDPSSSFFDPQAAGRARAAVHHWRRTYAMEAIFFGRLLAIRPVRAAIISATTGRRARAQAYCDWIRKPAMIGLVKSTDPNTNAGWFVEGFAEALNDAKVAPATVTIPDEQAGLIEVTPRLDPQGHASAMVFGAPKDGKLPDARLGTGNRLALDLYSQWDAVELADDFAMHVVLTVVPGTPNSAGRLWPVEVTAGQVGEANADGPVVAVRVYPGVCTARFAWSDDAENAIVAGIKGTAPLPAERLVDPELLQQVAEAAAKRVYDLFRDAPAGAMQVDLDPDIEPQGSLSSVSHRVIGGAATVTRPTFGGVRRPVDIWRYLPSSARRAIMHILNDGTVNR